MSTNDRPRELLSLRTALDVLDGCARDADRWAEQAAAVNPPPRPEYAARLNRLRAEIRVARFERVAGTPASIARVADELLGKR